MATKSPATQGFTQSEFAAATAEFEKIIGFTRTPKEETAPQAPHTNTIANDFYVANLAVLGAAHALEDNYQAGAGLGLIHAMNRLQASLTGAGLLPSN